MALVLRDLPDGWRGSPSEADEGDEKFRRCIGSDYSGFTIIGEAASDEFSMGEKNFGFLQGRCVRKRNRCTGGSLEEFASGMRSATVEDCLGDFVKEGIRGENYEVGEVDIGELSLPSPRSA
jgi:hypothetical protein